MRFLVRAYGKLRDVTTQGYSRKAPSEPESHHRPVPSTPAILGSLVGNEVGLPSSSGVPSARAVKIVRLGVETICKNVVAIEYEIGVVRQIDHAGRGRHSKIPRRFGAVAVEVLVPAIQWRGKNRAFLPFKRVFGLGMIPDRRRAMAGHDIDQFFEQVSLRFECFARRDLANIRVVALASSCETNPSSQSSGARPRLESNLSNIFDEKSLDERNPLALDPTPVGTFVLTDRSCGNFRFFHSIFSREQPYAPQPSAAGTSSNQLQIGTLP